MGLSRGELDASSAFLTLMLNRVAADLNATNHVMYSAGRTQTTNQHFQNH
jgi:hypothetical protein